MCPARVTKERADRISGGVFLIGLAILFLPNGIPFWPGILFVIGASQIAQGMAEGREWYSMQGALWMIGLGFLFWFGFSLPLLLILIGGSMLLGYHYRPPFMDGEDDPDEPFIVDEKPKRKAKRSAEDGLEYYEEPMAEDYDDPF